MTISEKFYHKKQKENSNNVNHTGSEDSHEKIIKPPFNKIKYFKKLNLRNHFKINMKYFHQN